MISRTCEQRNWPMVRIISRELGCRLEQDWYSKAQSAHNPETLLLAHHATLFSFFLEAPDYYQNHS